MENIEEDSFEVNEIEENAKNKNNKDNHVSKNPKYIYR